MKLSVPPVYVCAAVLQRADHCVLLVQRPINKSMGGMWEFPGGKIDEHERPEDTIVREVFEEINLQLHIDSLEPFTFISHTYENFHLNMFTFLCHNWTGDIILKENQQAFAWIHPHDLNNYLIPPADEPIIKRLQHEINRPSF
jgi:8-oxo-dGTP diphosphatase